MTAQPSSRSGKPIRLAILGRPNVGKSTLFNRLAGKRLAIVDDQPGVTRDRKEADGRLAGISLTLVDTAGFEDVTDASLEARMRQQTEAAIADCDVALFLFDARAGLVPMDERFAELLRGADKPVILAGNKCEGNAADAGLIEGWSLGFDEPIGLSAEHGEGMAELYQRISEVVGEEAFQDALAYEPNDRGPRFDPDEDDPADFDIDALEAPGPADALDDGPELPDEQPEDEPETSEPVRPAKLIVVGRPNAGKSTLINSLLESDRLLTGPEAGITRDSIAVDWEWEGRPIRLVDTAGMRRKAKVQEKLERFSVGESIRALKYADIIALVMDATEAFERQDLQIADLAVREGRGIVFVLTKWDLIADQNEAAKELREKAERLLPNAKGAPLVFLSGLTGKRIDRLMPAVLKVYDDWNAKVKTSDLNNWLRAVVERHPPPSVHGRPIKPKYMSQVKSRPPTFVLMANRGDAMPEQYKRYLINGLREAFDLPGVPIRLFVRQGRNPYAGKK